MATTASAIETQHPEFTEKDPDWIVMEDGHAGERKIKSRGSVYLPTTSGQRALGLGTGKEGQALYDAYITRATYPTILKDTANALVGQSPGTVVGEITRLASTRRGGSLNATSSRLTSNYNASRYRCHAWPSSAGRQVSSTTNTTTSRYSTTSRTRTSRPQSLSERVPVGAASAATEKS